MDVQEVCGPLFYFDKSDIIRSLFVRKFAILWYNGNTFILKVLE